MGIFTQSDEFVSPVAPWRLFKALVTDSCNLIPKLMPNVVKSIEFVEGDGGVGSIRHITFQEGIQPQFARNKVEAMDPHNLSYAYTLVEADGKMDKVETVLYEVQFAAGPTGVGSVSRMKTTYTTKGDDVVLTDEELRAGNQKALAMYKVVEAYLLGNPDA